VPRSLRGIVLAGALLLAGCGLGKNADPAAVEQTEVTKAQLAAMVLPAEELGPEVVKLEVDDDVGVVDNRQAADDSLDPDDTGKSLRGEGRLLGYKLSYSHPRLASANTKGVLGLGSLVEVLEGPVDAAQYLHARLNDYERFKNAVPGFKLSGYSTFEALVGDEAGGEQIKLTVRGVLTGYLTDVYFRRGRIVGSVEIVRTDREDAQEKALELADRARQPHPGRPLGRAEGGAREDADEGQRGERERAREASVPDPEGRGRRSGRRRRRRGPAAGRRLRGLLPRVRGCPRRRLAPDQAAGRDGAVPVEESRRARP
jgi:hypothetical protein